MIKVVIADDHPIMRQGLRKIIEEAPDIRLSDEAADGFEAIDKVEEQEIDVLVLDISMPNCGGIEVIKRLVEEGCRTRVLVLSVHSMKQYAVRVLRLGAAGYLTKETAEEELLEAVRTVASGKRYISTSLAAELADFIGTESWDKPLSRLSDREFAVLRHIVSGMSMKEIAFELNISVQTVSTYRSRLMQKLNIKSNAELIRFALSHGIDEAAP